MLVGASIRHLVGGEDAPREADLAILGADVIDQKYDSCFGQAWAGAACTQSGGKLKASGYALWTLARMIAAGDSRAPLADTGVYGHDILQAAKDFGIVALPRWKENESPEKRVPQDVIEAGQIAKLGAVHGIEETGEDLRRRIRQTVGLARQCVVFGMIVTEDYMDLDIGWWSGATGPVVGGHAQYIDAYDTAAVGIRNSWGKSWGAGGRVWIPWNTFLNIQTFDFQTAEFLPKEIR